jgi:hypothetical protein
VAGAVRGRRGCPIDHDTGLNWALADPLAIAIDEPNEVWHSGAARDVIALGPQAVLVASDTGGLWSANRGGTALPLGDFEHPDFSCLLPGVYGDEHIYAGGARLYETDLSRALPLLNWQKIPISYPATVDQQVRREDHGDHAGTGDQPDRHRPLSRADRRHINPRCVLVGRTAGARPAGRLPRRAVGEEAEAVHRRLRVAQGRRPA